MLSDDAFQRFMARVALVNLHLKTIERVPAHGNIKAFRVFCKLVFRRFRYSLRYKLSRRRVVYHRVEVT